MRDESGTIKEITVIPISIMRELFPEDTVLQQPYVKAEDWILVRPKSGLKAALMSQADLRDEGAIFDREKGPQPTPLFPDIVSGFLPGPISYLRIQHEEHGKIRDAGINVDVIADVDKARNIINPPEAEISMMAK